VNMPKIDKRFPLFTHKFQSALGSINSALMYSTEFKAASSKICLSRRDSKVERFDIVN